MHSITSDPSEQQHGEPLTLPCAESDRKTSRPTGFSVAWTRRRGARGVRLDRRPIKFSPQTVEV